MKRIARVIIFGLFFVTCSSKNYENEELIAIQDIANIFLQETLIPEELVYISEDSILIFPFSDSLNSRVFFSDGLFPISQVKKDYGWMFKESNLGTVDSALFYSIVNSKRFNELKFRNFDKTKIELLKPFKQFDRTQERIITGERYSIFNFSRICFDTKREIGVVVLGYTKGYENGTATGFRGPLLIKKQNGKWVYFKN